MKYKFAIFLFLFGAVFTTQSREAPKAQTREECDSLVISVGNTPGKLRSMPFARLHEAETALLECVNTFNLYEYSVADATISQVMLERCEEFIHERKLDDSFFAWDEKLYGK